jgi:hypothetical protein
MRPERDGRQRRQRLLHRRLRRRRAGGTPAITSGTLSLTVTGPNDLHGPASGGTATTFHVGVANTYSVACYGTGFSSAISGVTTRRRSPSTPDTLPATHRGHLASSARPVPSRHLGLRH